MIHLKKVPLLMAAILLLSVYSCRMGKSEYMSQGQQHRIEKAYDSIQSTYKRLMTDYNSLSGSMSPELQQMYASMQKMHSQMEMNHQQMMSMNMDQHMQQNHNKMRSMDMVIHMQDHRAGDWYQQLIGMHEQVSALHKKDGEPSMAKMNRKLANDFKGMRKMVPSIDEPTEVHFNEKGNPSFLNGKALFSDNCASCHGSDAKGIAGVFPPLLNSKWITGDKSIPTRILLNGLNGNIDVANQTYQGIMPSFRARLSAAEMASILNYIRSLSDKKLPEITQDDVIKIGKTYSKRTRPWTAEELK